MPVGWRAPSHRSADEGHFLGTAEVLGMTVEVSVQSKKMPPHGDARQC